MSDQPTDDFDLDAWIDGATRVTKYVEVYGKPSLQAAIAKMDAQLVRNPQDKILAKKIEAARAEMKASRRGFTLTALSDSERDRINDEVADEDERVWHVLAAQCVEPKMTPAQAKRLPQVLGDGYFAATNLAAAGEAIRGVGVDVPFSSLAYGLLNT